MVQIETMSQITSYANGSAVMTLGSFMVYVGMSRECPIYINPNRWAGMLKWYDAEKAGLHDR